MEIAFGYVTLASSPGNPNSWWFLGGPEQAKVMWWVHAANSAWNVTVDRGGVTLLSYFNHKNIFGSSRDENETSDVLAIKYQWLGHCCRNNINALDKMM